MKKKLMLDLLPCLVHLGLIGQRNYLNLKMLRVFLEPHKITLDVNGGIIKGGIIYLDN